MTDRLDPLEPMTILVVDDDSAVRAHLAALIDAAGHRVIEAAGADWALELFHRHRPQLVFSDVDMPGQGGYALARRIREQENGPWTPIVFLSALARPEHVAEGLEAGGDDYLVKPVHPVVLQAKIGAMRRLRSMQARLWTLSQDLQQANVALRRQSERDPLTGLLNRRGMDLCLATALRQARRKGAPLTLMLCDVDHFKRYNDRLGHQAGDECLRRVAALLAQVARRPHDAAARYGGEEFALILPDTPKSGALTLARAITRVFGAAALPHPASDAAAHVTLSGGITTCVPDEGTTPSDLLLRADESLYVAKAKGRNRFFSFEMQTASEAPAVA